jgi:hypothetical protein
MGAICAVSLLGYRSSGMLIDIQVKEAAEQFFFNFIQAPKIDIFLELMNRGSDFLVFALFNYSIKYPHQLIKNN